MEKILVLGSQGQVGSEVLRLLGDRATGWDREDCDLTQLDRLSDQLQAFQPQSIINCVAYNQVNRAEQEEAQAHLINAEAPAFLAKFCADRSLPFVTYSTDYVFSGEGDRPWTEEDSPAPLNAYGRSKAAGEKKVTEVGGHYAIFRTSWVYDPERNNFLNLMLNLAFQEEREEIQVVTDQIGAPTYATDLAEATLQALPLIAAGKAAGVYHLCQQGETSWYGFAEQIFQECERRGATPRFKKLRGVTTAEFESSHPPTVPRPLNSRLSTKKTRQELGLELPTWETALKSCMDRIQESRFEHHSIYNPRSKTH